jgi:uncharacterized repeat protein (TIGR03803 family)
MAKLRVSALALMLAVFLYAPLSAQAQSTSTFTVLYAFTGNNDGANPSTVTMVRDAQGNLYGTTHLGGDLTCNVSLHPGCGTVFKLDPAGILTPLHIFGGGAQGLGPSGVVRDAAGNIYGTAGGGIQYGLVFKVDNGGTYTELYNFTGGPDGNLPTGSLILDTSDASGNLYGTTLLGGGSSDPKCPNGEGCGTIFELENTRTHKVLYSFLNNADGAEPQSVVRDSTGNFFGATYQGGQGCLLGCGTIFKLDATGNKTVLHTFTGGKDGANPSGNLVQDSAGNLYGVTTAGGDLACPWDGGAGCGVVFKVDTKGVLTVLHAFHGGSDGNVPVSVILDAAGNLYGTTQSGPNANTCGIVFKLDIKSNLTNLHSLAGGSEGCQPAGALVRDAAGNLYGATVFAGYSGNPYVCPNGCGTIFKVTP